MKSFLFSIWDLPLLEILALIISGIALWFTWVENKERKKEIKRSDKKAERALKLAEGSSELALRSALSEARAKVAIASKDLKDFKRQNVGEDTSFHLKLFYSSVEDLLNHYEGACAMYLDDKIDKKRFRKDYEIHIVNLIEKGGYGERYFNPKNERYPVILEVYKKWTGKDL